MCRQSLSLLHDEQDLADGSHKTRPRATTRPNTADGGGGASRLACRGLQEEARLMDAVHTGQKCQEGAHVPPFTCSTHETTVQVTDSPQWEGVHGQITLLLQSLATRKTYKQDQLEGQVQRASSIQGGQSPLPRRQLTGAACRVVRAKSAKLFEQVASGPSWPLWEDEQASSTLLSKPEA